MIETTRIRARLLESVMQAACGARERVCVCFSGIGHSILRLSHFTLSACSQFINHCARLISGVLVQAFECEEQIIQFPKEFISWLKMTHCGDNFAARRDFDADYRLSLSDSLGFIICMLTPHEIS